MQQRPFFQAANIHIDGHCRGKKRLGPWTAVILALLLCSCSSLTPERVNVVASIAGQAAAVGAGEWLAKHTNHVAAFKAVIDALSAVQKTTNANAQAREDAAVELLSSLPTDALRGPDGELYVAGDGGLIIWDAKLKKAVTVRGPARIPVVKATLSGLKRAMLPKPPALVALNKPQYLDFGPGPATNNISLFTATPSVPLHITSVVASATDVTPTNVTLRWLATPGSRYQIEHRDMTNAPWVKMTEPWPKPGPATLQIEWPTNKQPGEWRVARTR